MRTSNNLKPKFKQVRIDNGQGKSKWTNADKRHPYLKVEFWITPLNQFWNTGMYSEESKEYFNTWVQKLSSDFNHSHILNIK